MDPVVVGMLGTVALVVLIFLGIHIGIVLMLVGIVGLLMMGMPEVIGLVGLSLFNFTWVYSFIMLPLFILMGTFAFRAGIAESAYKTLYKWVQRIPGALAVATTFGCAAFGAVSTSSMSATVVFGRISLPEMTKYKYAKSLSLGCVAAAGTFACMIPPSTLFIIYSMFTETSIGRLFMAGIIPGLTTALVYAASIIIRVKRNPALAPPSAEKLIPWKERIVSLKDVWPVLILVILVLGGIYGGVFTIGEAGAAGCAGALLIGVFIKGRKFDIRGSLRETAQTTAMVFLIVIGALFFSRFLGATRLPIYFAEFLQGLPVPGEIIIVGIFALFFVLGMIIMPIGIIAMLIPVVFPVILELGFDPIWFGVIITKASEIAAVTPPVGMNVYALKGVVGKQATLAEIFNGIWPFVICDIVVFGLMIVFPQMCLWLPSMMKGG